MSSKQPLHTVIYDAIVDRIRTGEWAAGDSLPSENELVKEFGTSRGPVRQALSRLRIEGHIIGGRGAPPRVHKPIPSQPFTYHTSFSDWAAELGYIPGRKTIEIARRLADERAAEAVKINVDDPVVTVSRVRTFDQDPVMLEYGLYPYPGGQHLLSADLDTQSIFQILHEYDIVIMKAHNVIDAVAADDFAARWLGVKVGDPLLRLRRTSYGKNGDVIDYVENRYLPSRVTFTVENTHESPGTPLTHVAVTEPTEQ